MSYLNSNYRNKQVIKNVECTAYIISVSLNCLNSIMLMSKSDSKVDCGAKTTSPVSLSLAGIDSEQPIGHTLLGHASAEDDESGRRGNTANRRPKRDDTKQAQEADKRNE